MKTLLFTTLFAVSGYAAASIQPIPADKLTPMPQVLTAACTSASVDALKVVKKNENKLQADDSLMLQCLLATSVEGNLEVGNYILDKYPDSMFLTMDYFGNIVTIFQSFSNSGFKYEKENAPAQLEFKLKVLKGFTYSAQSPLVDNINYKVMNSHNLLGYILQSMPAFKGKHDFLPEIKSLGDRGSELADDRGYSFLLDAVVQKEMGVVKYFLSLGVQVTTEVHNAVSNDDLEMLKYLLAHGGDKNNQNRSGESLLHTAVSGRGHLAMAKYLVSIGVDKTIKNKKGNTAYDNITIYGGYEDKTMEAEMRALLK
jgi:hypothetical protein